MDNNALKIAHACLSILILRLESNSLDLTFQCNTPLGRASGVVLQL